MFRVFLFSLIFTTLFVTACSNKTENHEEYPFDHYEDDKMIGFVLEINKNESNIVVDISEWEKRDRKGPGMTDEGYYYNVKINDQTVIAHEDDKEATIEDIKKGQKVLVNPPRGDSFEGHAHEIILLEMSYEEKFSRILPQSDGVHIVIMYEDGTTLPIEMEEALFENVTNILEGTNYHVSARWVPYDENYIVDYKEELDIEQFPAMLVFENKEQIFKGYSVDELYEFFRRMSE